MMLPQGGENQMGSATALQRRARSSAALHGKVVMHNHREDPGADVGIFLSKRLSSSSQAVENHWRSSQAGNSVS